MKRLAAFLAGLVLTITVGCWAQVGGGFPPHVPPAFRCTTACSVAGIVVGQSAIIAGGSGTTRASTTTDTSDARFQFTNVPAGTYEIRATLSFTPAAAGGGYKYQLASAASSEILTGVTDCVGIGAPASASTGGDITTCTSVSATPNPNSFWGAIGANASDTIALQWSQNTSNANATTLNATNSYMILTRIL